MRTKRANLIALALLVLALAALAPATAQDAAAPAEADKKPIMVGQYNINDLPKEVYDALMDKMWQEEHQEPPLVLKSYDVADLLADAPDYTFSRVSDSPLERPGYYGYSNSCGGGGVSLFEDTTCCDDSYAPAEKLRELIIRMVPREGPREEVWEDMGGRGTIAFREREGYMLVTTTEETHNSQYF